MLWFDIRKETAKICTDLHIKYVLKIDQKGQGAPLSLIWVPVHLLKESLLALLTDPFKGNSFETRVIT